MEQQPVGELANVALDHWKSRDFTECVKVLDALEYQLKMADETTNLNNEVDNEASMELQISKQQLKFNQTLAKFALAAMDKKVISSQESVRALKDFAEFVAKTRKDGSQTRGEEANLQRGQNNGVQSMPTELLGKVSVENEAVALVLYNCAVVYVHLGKFSTAIEILESIQVWVMKQGSDAIENHSLVLRVGFLLLDTYTRCGWGLTGNSLAHIVSRCNEVVAMLRLGFSFSKGVEVVKDEEDKEVVEFEFRLHLFKAKIQLLQRKVSGSKKELKSALEIFQRELKPRLPSKHESSDSNKLNASETLLDVGFKLDSPLPGPGAAVQGAACNTPALLLKANLEYLRENYKKSLKLLASCSQSGIHPGIYHNNVACVHSNLKQHQCATTHLVHALKAYREANQSTATPVGDQRSAEVLFNLGLSLLQSGQPRIAFSCLLEASPVLYNRPRLWLRVAEAVVMAYQQGAKVVASTSGEQDASGVSAGSNSARSLVQRSSNTPGATRININITGSNALNVPTFANEARASQSIKSALTGSESDPTSSPLEHLLPVSKSQIETMGKQDSLDEKTDNVDQQLRSSIGINSNSVQHKFESFATVKNTAQPLSFEVGIQATYNVIHLLDVEEKMKRQHNDIEENGNDDDNGFSDGEEVPKNGSSPTKPESSEPQVGSRSIQVRLAALLIRGYLSLCMDNPGLAAKSIRQYLSISASYDASDVPIMPPQFDALAHSYLAEAVLVLGFVEEAADHVEKAYSIGDQTFAPSRSGDSATTPEALMRSALCSNLATVRMAQGQLVLAEEALLQALHIVPHSTDALRGLLFLYLKNGKINAALQVLKTRRAVPLASK